MASSPETPESVPEPGSGHGDGGSDGNGSEERVTAAARLLALQATDTEADRLRARLERLEEREEHAARRADVTAWEQRLAAHESRIGELTTVIETAEETGASLDAQKSRLEQQLKTVIAPREAEALMHEIATVDEQRDANETAELLALEELTEVESALAAHRAGEDACRAALAAAEEALARAVAGIESELAELDRRRAEERAAIDGSMLLTYDRVRGQLGVAIAELSGKMCGGCHLDLSAAEIDTVREAAALAGGVADCPQCGRILVP